MKTAVLTVLGVTAFVVPFAMKMSAQQGSKPATYITSSALSFTLTSLSLISILLAPRSSVIPDDSRVTLFSLASVSPLTCHTSPAVADLQAHFMCASRRS